MMGENFHIEIARTDADIRACWPVMKQLRPHLSEAEFLAQVFRQQQSAGYVLAYIEEKEQGARSKEQKSESVRAVTGFRVTEFLAWGKTLYIDDLVAAEATRGGGFASKLFDWVVEYAKKENCDELHLDSGAGPHRYRAHRFYLVKGMDITSHHFVLKLK
jgi:GNAT superfamily N-acetyltransferase